MSSNPIVRRVAKSPSVAPSADWPSPVRLQVFTKHNGILTKRVSRPHGTDLRIDASACAMSKGEVETYQFSSMVDLDKLVASLRRNQAICLSSKDLASDLMGPWQVVSKEQQKSNPDAITRTKENFPFESAIPALIMFDRDSSDGEVMSATRAQEILCHVIPDFDCLAMLATHSSSSFIFERGRDKQLRGEGNTHTYIVVCDGADIPRFVCALEGLLWLKGHGRPFIDNTGTIHTRTVFDLTVFSPERLIFEAGAVVGTELEQRRPAPIYREGHWLDTRKLPDLSAEQLERVEKLKRDALASVRGEAAEVRAKYKAAEKAKLTELGVSEEAIDRILKGRLSRNLEPGDHLYFDHLETSVTVAAVLARCTEFDGKSLADPLEPDYQGQPGSIVRGKAKFFANGDGGKPVINSFAHGGRQFFLSDPLAGFDTIADDPATIGASNSSWAVPAPISAAEWQHARATPDCIVERYLYADVACFIAPGGVGKTTLKLYEAIHIVLGMPLHGLEVLRPGPVLIITAEDSREMLVARLRLITDSMQLTYEQKSIVMRNVLISDVSGSGFRLTRIHEDSVITSDEVDALIDACMGLKPVLVVIDPAVSFGVGESRVNDAEQGLIEAARRMRRALNCCVQYIHHTGKASARDQTTDQYSGRGGSAFADGARMVHVMQNVNSEKWFKETGETLAPGESGLILSRPKMSYCPPQEPILIRRQGYRFVQARALMVSKEDKSRVNADLVWKKLRQELVNGRQHSRNTLESIDTAMSRSELRKAVDWLVASGRVEDREIAQTAPNGKRRYLHPVDPANRPANGP